MKIAVTGSSGLVGSALLPFLAAEGHRVTPIVRPRTRPGPGQIVWDPDAGRLDPAALEGFDGVIHLAGENIAGARWTPERKTLLRESRVKSTRLLAETLAKLEQPPRVLISASATGYYGDRGDELLTEESASGSGFAPHLCREWEDAAEAAAASGIRTVKLRFGIVLSPSGGALARMLPPFRAGLGGPLGGGRHYMSWIALDDVTAVIRHALLNEGLRGAVNAVAPQAVTNRDFTRTLARVLGRPAFLAVPPFVLRLAFGELADALLLASVRAAPARLEASGYRFLYPALDPALRHLLGRSR